MYKKSGLQFTNYIYENKVIKKPKTFLGILIKNLSWHPKLIFSPIKLYKQSLQSFFYTKKNIELIKIKKEIHKFLGNIKINNNSIIQEKITPLGNLLRTNSLEENKKLLIRYFEFVHKIWSYGFFETTFNFTINYGINKENKINLIDIGEISFDMGKIREYIRKKHWLQNWSYNKDTPKELKEFYRNTAEKYFTPTNLNKYWERNSKLFI